MGTASVAAQEVLTSQFQSAPEVCEPGLHQPKSSSVTPLEPDEVLSRSQLLDAATHWSLDTVHGRPEIERTLEQLGSSCRSEIVSITGGRTPGWLEAAAHNANGRALAAGARARIIHRNVNLREIVTLREAAVAAHLAALVRQGADVRLATIVPGHGMVIDRETLVLTITNDEAQAPSLAIVQEASVLEWFNTGFEYFWAMATPIEELQAPAGRLPELSRQLVLDPIRIRILRLMADGEKDEVIARRLSISVRTCRRHIADYLEQVGAASRFQAGVIAAQQGHLNLLG